MQKAWKSIHENPWYILATLFGEQTGTELDRALHDKNRAAWNSWALHNLSDCEQEDLIQRHGVFKGEVLPWADFEHLFYQRLEGALSERIIINLTEKNRLSPVPSPIEDIDLSELTFKRIFCIEDFYFPSHVNFNGSEFSHELESGWSVFSDSVAFNGVKFHKLCDFSDSKFLSVANFNEASFESESHWIGAHFLGSAGFSRGIAFGTEGVSVCPCG